MSKLLIYDHGLCTELAVTLARAGHDVKYYVPWEEAFPKLPKALIGFGLEGVERIPHPFDRVKRRLSFDDYVDWADVLIFPDTYCASKVVYYRKHGYPVWGAGTAEWLENDRAATKALQKELGLPVQPVAVLQGVENVEKYLKTHEDVYVKWDGVRGDEFESFDSKNYDFTRAQML